MRYIILSTLIWVATFSWAEPVELASKYPVLSDSTEISLLTLGPSQQELYSAFGHSALRVYDPLNRIDAVFNYGIFDFNQPNFYLNFTRGKLNYMLGIQPYKRLISAYQRENRDITEQVFDLTKDEKQELFNLLMVNAEPENRFYFYNYCYDNCATKIRDIFSEVLDERIQYNFDYAQDSLSYRGLMDRYLGQQLWGDLAIDLCLGSEIDQTADGLAYLYMPEYLMIAFKGAQVNQNGEFKPLIKTTKKLHQAAPVLDVTSPISPLTFTIVLFFVIGILTHRGLKYKVNYPLMDYLLFGSTGVLGFLLLLLWVATDHLSQYNLNIVWCTPFNLIALILLISKKQTKFLRLYLVAYALLLILLLVSNGLMIQQLHLAFVPIILSLVIRALYIARNLKGRIN